MRRRNLHVVLVVMAVVLSACGTPSRAPRTLTVLAAASLTDAFTEIGKAFEAASPGVEVVFSFAASQALRTQIEEGAAADVFAAANRKEIDALAAAGLAGEARPFARNQLLIIAPSDNPAGLSAPADLARPGLKLVLAAEEVPIGKYAREALANLDELYGGGYQDAVLGNVASNEENVKQVVAKVELGEADAGIVYRTDALAAPNLVTIAIPAEQNVIAVYPVAVLQGSAEPELAEAFVAYILCDAGQAVLRAWGFSPPD